MPSATPNAREGMGEPSGSPPDEPGRRGCFGRSSMGARAPDVVNVNFPALAPDAVKGVRSRSRALRLGRLRIVQRTDHG